MLTILFSITLSLFVTQTGYVTTGKSMRLENNTRMFYSVSKPMLKMEPNYPLMIVMHWGWETNYGAPSFYGEEFMYEMIMPALMDCNFRPVVIAPDCPDDSWMTPRSEEVLKILIAEMYEKYKIDTTNVIMCGFGDGGNGSWCFANRNPEIVKTCIPIASLPEMDWIDFSLVRKTYVLQGGEDPLFVDDSLNNSASKKISMSDSLEMFVVKGATHFDGSLYTKQLAKIFKSLEKW